LLGVHCGFTELDIDNFSYIFYKDCLNELAVKLNYEGIINILANPFVEDSMDIVSQYSPFTYSSEKQEKKPNRITMKDLQQMGLA